jgi:hypothetical protein
MSPELARELGISDGTWVRVTSPYGPVRVAPRWRFCQGKGRPSPLPRSNHRCGHPTPQRGVEVEREWKRADCRMPGSHEHRLKPCETRRKFSAAKPIPAVLKAPEIPSQRDILEELQRKLDEAPLQHAAAVLPPYEPIQSLHKSGALDLLRGFFGANREIIGSLAEAMNSPGTIRGFRKQVALAQVLGCVEPKVFEDFRDALTEAARKNMPGNGELPGLWTILKRADGENSLRALGG